MKILKVQNLSISFGGLKAVDNLSFEVENNSIYGLIGPNGAGKTTVFNCISRFYTPDSGKVLFSPNGKEVDLLDYQVHQVIDKGLARTFQNVELFNNLTVLENLMVGHHGKTKTNFFAEGLRLPFVNNEEKRVKDKALEILDFLNLNGIEGLQASAQPYGVQKMLELGRVLMSDAKLIILDEPAAGMNDTETDKLAETIKRIRDHYKVTILLVEHDMGLVMDICERICAINFGKKIAEGTPKEIQNSVEVQEAYLGKGD
ncbi:ABC transporter ATP-binding protein [Proteinivorax tanatarense]|uniref:ABC transporter ATP-binding protein n=1 Tax=Proteinivorax tanatarense TaxID=1260629 RepID=A0AAU7VND5_9FIRM